MASGGRRKKKDNDKDDEPGIGTFLAAGAAAAGIAAFAFGAKKLYDYLTEEEPAKEVPDECIPPRTPEVSPQSASSRHSRELPKTTVPSVLTPPAKPQMVPLADQLRQYHEEYACVPHEEMHRAQQVLYNIKDLIIDYFCEHHHQFGVTSLTNIGSAFENLKVVSADKFDLVIPISLNNDLWQLEEGPSSYFHIKRSIPDKSEYFDSYLEDSSLSPLKVATALQEAFQEIPNCLTKYHLQSSSSAVTIVLSVWYDDGKNFTIHLTPAICLQGTLVTATSQRQDDNGSTNLWRQCYSLREAQKLRILDPAKSCHLACLKIMKAICLNHHGQFGAFNSYIFKTVLLHMMHDTPEEELWDHQCLQEQFVDMLNQLVYYLQGRNLPHFFDRRVNLLQGISPDSCDYLVTFILNRIGKEKLHSLLSRVHQPCLDVGPVIS